MGEALMPRRGGGVRKHGTISNLAADVASHTISDPGLIGAKNAVIFAVKEKLETYTSSDTSLVFILIEDGVVTGMLNEYREYIRFVRDPAITFDPDIGEVYSSAYSPFWSKGGAVPYEYIVYD